MKFAPLVFGCLLLTLTSSGMADQTTIAVAANFSAPMKAIVADFERSSPHQVTLSFGSSGKFFAQIRNGAPYDILFSADQAKPLALLEHRLAAADTRFTYAVGKLLLWSADANLLAKGNEPLLNGSFSKLAIANPRLAPYGSAARQVLDALPLPPAVSQKLVQGENIAQTFQFVRSGNAELGFVAASQILALPANMRGSSWEIPPELYDPIRQDAVLLKRGSNNPAARAFLTFTRQPEARDIIESYGYTVPSIE